MIPAPALCGEWYGLLQVNALREYYAGLTPNEMRLNKADYLGFRVFPSIAMLFIACYWVQGLMKYNSPDWSNYTFLIPELKVLDTISVQPEFNPSH